MQLTIKHPFIPQNRSLATSLVMSTFGIDFDQQDHCVAENLSVELQARQVLLASGPSGSGKSSILRAIVKELSSAGHFILNLDEIHHSDRPLIDCLPLSCAVQWLTACGLGEPRLFLRTPGELSDGQRYRLRISLAMHQLSMRKDSPTWLLADEFTAPLDRTLAQVVAFNLSRMARKLGIGCLLASTHEDIRPDLHPDVWLRPNWDGHFGVEYGGHSLNMSTSPEGGRPSSARSISFFPLVGSARAAGPTGSVSPTGITAPRLWVPSAR